MINSGRSDPVKNKKNEKSPIPDDLSAIIDYESDKIDNSAKTSFETLIKKLTVLERKNARNEQIIIDLRYFY